MKLEVFRALRYTKESLKHLFICGMNSRGWRNADIDFIELGVYHDSKCSCKRSVCSLKNGGKGFASSHPVQDQQAFPAI